MNVDEATAQEFKAPTYYSSQSEHGPKRLVELLQESAFYSSKLHAASGQVLTFIIGILLLIFAAAAIIAIPIWPTDILMLLARLILVGTIFILSADVLGARREHLACASATSEILARTEIFLLGETKSDADALLMLEDYTSAIESAPEMVPFVYESKAKRLSELWQRYSADQQSGHKK